MKVEQARIRLRPRPRGFHLITREIEDAIPSAWQIDRGIAHIQILHTSAGLTLNENADPDVRTDMEAVFSHLVPENEPYYVHTIEGPDDMPAHVKASLLGAGVTVPVSDGRLVLGTWQGIYLCEHRDRAGGREIFITMIGV
ncbi:MAG: YjbQ family protein [Spirochaetaceae bacterium]|nr:MAG: YjbQ family protein [Spirochaetaceae bacterium]